MNQPRIEIALLLIICGFGAIMNTMTWGKIAAVRDVVIAATTATEIQTEVKHGDKVHTVKSIRQQDESFLIFSARHAMDIEVFLSTLPK